jgi:hypothetical protein
VRRLLRCGVVQQSITQIQGLGETSPPDAAAAVLALRTRAATALEAALGFVEDYGDELALARAHAALEAIPPQRCADAVARLQSDDGSFDPFGGVFSGALAAELRDARLPPPILGSLEALSVLADLRALGSDCAERTLAFLTREQQSDGSWGRADPIAAAAGPEGAEERAVSERLFATGMLAGFAARTPFARPELLDWAGRFLAGLWAPERVEGGRWSAIAAFAHFYANGGDPDNADGALQWCGRELERGFRTGRFDAGTTLRVLLYCDARALPGSTFDGVELLTGVLGEQAADGGFAELDPGGPPGRVAPTLDALIAVRGLCQSL